MATITDDVGFSGDGVHWGWQTPISPWPFGDTTLQGVMVRYDSGTGLLVAMISGASNNHLVYTSGLAWNACTTPALPTGGGAGSSYATNTTGVSVLAYSVSGTNHQYVSSDDITWTAVGGSPTMGLVAWDPGHSHFIGASGSNFYSSTDGSTWSLISTNPIGAIASLHTAGSFAFAASGGSLNYSSDGGVTWTGATDTNGTWWGGAGVGHAPSNISYSGSVYLLVTPQGTATHNVTVITSTNGTSWTEATGSAPAGSVSLEDSAWSPSLGLFVAGTFGVGALPAPFYSTNGTTWTEGVVTAPTPAANVACFSLSNTAGSGFAVAGSLVWSTTAPTAAPPWHL